MSHYHLEQANGSPGGELRAGAIDELTPRSTRHVLRALSQNASPLAAGLSLSAEDVRAVSARAERRMLAAMQEKQRGERPVQRRELSTAQLALLEYLSTGSARE